MPRVIPIELEQEICEKYKTHTAKELSAIYGFKPNTIKGVWRRHGLSGKNIFSPDVEQFKIDYKSMLIKEVAEKYHTDHQTVTNFAKKIGIYEFPKPLLTEQQKKDIISLYEEQASTSLATEYHVSKSEIGKLWREAGLKGKDRRRYKLNENFFDNINTEHKAYWLGLIASDGCIYHHKASDTDGVRICLQASDANILDNFRADLETQKPLSFYTRKNDNAQYVAFEITSDKLVAGLKKQGLTYRKTKTLTLPPLPTDLYPAYFRGYFDGDGTISKNFEVNTLHSVNVSISGYNSNLETMQQCLQKNFNIPSKITRDKRNYNTEKENDFFGALCFTNKRTKADFLHLIYDNATVFLSRKYSLAQKFFELFQQNPRTWTLK